MGTKSICLLYLGALMFSIDVSNGDDTGNANIYIDTVLENLRKEPEVADHLDPLKIPSLSGQHYEIKNVKVNGLSHMYRHGDCTISYNDKRVDVIGEIAVKDVTVTFDHSAKVLFFWIHGNGLISVDHLTIKLDFTSIDGNARVNSLKVTNLGDYRMKRITGLSPAFNWLLKIITNNIVQGVRGNIIHAVENEGKNALNNLLSQYKLPIY